MKPSFCSKRYQKRSTRLQVTRLLLLVLLLVSGFMFTRQLVQTRREQAEFEALASLVPQNPVTDDPQIIPPPQRPRGRSRHKNR